MTTESGMNFSQEVPPFLIGDAPLKDSSIAFLVELSLMNLVVFRMSNDAMSLILVLMELPPIKVGQEGFSPWSYYRHT